MRNIAIALVVAVAVLAGVTGPAAAAPRSPASCGLRDWSTKTENGLLMGVGIVLDFKCQVIAVEGWLGQGAHRYGHFSFWGPDGDIGNDEQGDAWYEGSSMGRKYITPYITKPGDLWCGIFWEKRGNVWYQLIQHCNTA
jgi:hypothetical protein